MESQVPRGAAVFIFHYETGLSDEAQLTHRGCQQGQEALEVPAAAPTQQ
jgi:hypothetical protein